MENQAVGWQAPATRMIGNGGKWEFTNGISPTFDRREHWEEDSDDDEVADLADGAADCGKSQHTQAKPSHCFCETGRVP